VITPEQAARLSDRDVAERPVGTQWAQALSDARLVDEAQRGDVDGAELGRAGTQVCARARGRPVRGRRQGEHQQRRYERGSVLITARPPNCCNV